MPGRETALVTMHGLPELEIGIAAIPAPYTLVMYEPFGLVPQLIYESSVSPYLPWTIEASSSVQPANLLIRSLSYSGCKSLPSSSKDPK